jgi:hypothetical protein
MHGERRENLSKSGALERIGIALAGIVGHRQTVNKGFSDIRNFSFAEFASGGFRTYSSESARAPQSRRTPFELYAAKGILKPSPGKRRSLWQAGDRQSETDTGGAESVLMVLPSFGRARESRNLLTARMRSDLADAESEAAVSGSAGEDGVRLGDDVLHDCAIRRLLLDCDAQRRASLPLTLKVAARFGLGLQVIESSLFGHRATPIAAVDDDLED